MQILPSPMRRYSCAECCTHGLPYQPENLCGANITVMCLQSNQNFNSHDMEPWKLKRLKNIEKDMVLANQAQNCSNNYMYMNVVTKRQNAWAESSRSVSAGWL